MIKNKSPDISIIITNFNYEKYIQRAIRSCLNQKNVNHEVIVVDAYSNASLYKLFNNGENRNKHQRAEEFLQ